MTLVKVSERQLVIKSFSMYQKSVEYLHFFDFLTSELTYVYHYVKIMWKPVENSFLQLQDRKEKDNMYELEIETKNKLKKIKNPRKARIKDMIFWDLLQVMDGDGIWQTICVCDVGVESGQFIVNRINRIIERHQPSVYVNI